MSNEAEEIVEIDLREYLQILWERKKLILGITLLIVLLTGLITFYVLDPVYEAEATIKLGTHKGEFSKPKLAKGLLKSTSYFQRVNQSLNKDYSVYELKEMAEEKLRIESGGDQLLFVSLQDKQPQEAKLMLDELMNIFKTDSLKEFNQITNRQKKQLEEINSDLASLQKNIAQLESESDLPTSNLSPVDKIVLNWGKKVSFQGLMETKADLIEKKYELKTELQQIESPEIIDRPSTPQEPIKPNNKLNLVISLVLGLALGVMTAFLVELLGEEVE